MVSNNWVSKPNCNDIQTELMRKVTNSIHTWVLVGPLPDSTCVRASEVWGGDVQGSDGRGGDGRAGDK